MNIKKNIKYLKMVFKSAVDFGLNNIAHNNSNITHHCSANTAQITTTIIPSN